MPTLVRLLLPLGLLAACACGRAQRSDSVRAPPGQPPAPSRPFGEFEKIWREQLISTAPELALPVTRREEPVRVPWQPRIVTECVYSGDLRTLVPQVTFTWNDAASEPSPEVASTVQRAAAAPRLRFDLALHYNAFARNYYSTALATNRNDRFKLAANSPMVNDEAAVLLTGPGLFPRLADFNVQPIQDRDTAQRFSHNTLVVRELSHGLSYTLRLDRPTAKGWSEDGQVVFLTPICPTTS
jgi:hypothetical protein